MSATTAADEKPSPEQELTEFLAPAQQSDETSPMRIPGVILIVFLCASPLVAADKPPVYLWLEPEWFDGVQGSFGSWTGEAKPTGSWGIAGPGISAEWTQGGESEWNSMGAPAAETKADCHRDLVIPRAGKYRVWVRYVDHRKQTEPFTVTVAQGGGAKGDTVYGSTDELGMHAIEGVATMHDLHATLLHLLGLDHEKLTYRYGGRDFRLTDVHGRVIKEIIT
jgi:hypothetical protein